MERYIFEKCNGNTGFNIELATAEDAKAEAVNMWEAMTKADKASYKAETGAMFRAFTIEVPENMTLAEAIEEDPTLDTFWKADIISMI